ncbi:hypothetical protein MYX82_01245 [Acidobacteria bacterium AH-259-D05]|nr:hypothetical protein [Acidobacteria bacterium AH-259-D05]
MSKVEKENTELKKALKRLEAQSNELQERMVKREAIDAFLTILLKDGDLRKVLVERIKGEGSRKNTAKYLVFSNL